jgi:SpoVK/Ycf46/Vps4 family AAA+-type ATPase
VEFVAPKHGLDLVVAERAVRERLEQDVALFRSGRFDALPMGYLFCGVIGTGKTFTATCFAGSLGIPAVVFRNLRSKWVGSSEGNLQKVLSVTKALSPVAVIIDEADAALGTRAASGDSGTGSRMFAMLSTLMSDTEYRGRILWMLLTSRPDLLPVDLKRQGRCEVHIPLFPPSTDETRREMFVALARKAGLAVDAADVPSIPQGLSGADIESLVVSSIRRAAIRSETSPSREIFREALAHFRAPEYGLEKELQELVAVREATDPAFVPEPLRDRYASPEKSGALERRIQEILALLPVASR